MPRQKASIKVDTYHNEHFGVLIDLLYNPNTHQHEATFGSRFEGKSFEALAIDDLRRQLALYLRACSDLTWQPVIKLVRSGEQYRVGTHFELKLVLERFYWAALPGEQYRQIYWDHDASQGSAWRAEHSNSFRPFPFSLPKAEYPTAFTPPQHFSDGTHYLPYTEEVWQGLLALVARLGTLRDTLDQLIGTEDGAALIARVGGQALLPAPRDEVSA